MRAFILKDLHFTNKWAKPPFDQLCFGGGQWAGKLVCMMGDNQHEEIDVNGPPGYIPGVYYGYTFTLNKDGYTIIKFDEWTQASPAHPTLYNVAQAHRAELTGKVKTYLDSIAESVAAYELTLHDIRRYNEHLGFVKKAESADETEMWEGELALRTIYIDEVDRNSGAPTETGGGVYSMVFMRAKGIFPTIVEDFKAMKSLDDFKAGGKFANLPEPEKAMLATKWFWYQEWKKMWMSELKARLERLEPVRASREKVIEEQRRWLVPRIAELRMLEEGLERRHVREMFRSAFVKAGHTVTSVYGLDFWLWKKYPVFEVFPTPGELLAKTPVVEPGWGPLDAWTRENLIFGVEHGLINDFPWITEEWVKLKVDETKSKNWWDKDTWYYTFTVVQLEKWNLSTPQGEDEDGTFIIDNWMVSLNVLMTKFLEHLARNEEHEFYINDMLGMPNEIPGKPVVLYSKKKGKYFVDAAHYKKIMKFKYGGLKNPDKKLPSFPKEGFASKEFFKMFLKDQVHLVKMKIGSKLEAGAKDLARTLGLNFAIMRYSGPYERGFYDRMNQYFLKPNGLRFVKQTALLLELSGFGKPA